MTDNNSKVPIYIAIVVAVVIIAAGAFFLSGGPSDNGQVTPVPTKTPTPTHTIEKTEAPTPEKTTTVSTAPPTTPKPKQVETVKCELCHTEPAKLSPHINGGKYCVNCHGTQVHSIHTGSGTVNLRCDLCHGNPPKIPTVNKSGEGPGHYSVCEKCHAAPPNSLQPSNGNLIVIHLSRGKYCTNCHGTNVANIHKKALSKMSES